MHSSFWPTAACQINHKWSMKTNPCYDDFMQGRSWFQQARLGMFVTYGVYARIARNEWVMNQEAWPLDVYDRQISGWNPVRGCAGHWLDAAVACGARYAVLVAKHCDGIALWKSAANPRNTHKLLGGRDLVREFVDACHARKIVPCLYYSLVDWANPDCAASYRDTAARKRFLRYTRESTRELMSGYGKIGTLWYDAPWPLRTPEDWESADMNRMVRELQPRILINDRSLMPGDFKTYERNLPSNVDGLWESCLPLNDDWGFAAREKEDMFTARQLVSFLYGCVKRGGNLLVNVGPDAQGRIPTAQRRVLAQLGAWFRRNRSVVDTVMDRPDGNVPAITNTGFWTVRGKTGWFWLNRVWPGRELILGGMTSKALSAEWVGFPSLKQPRLKQEAKRLIIQGLPPRNPDRLTGTAILKIEFASKPKQFFPYPSYDNMDMI